MKQRPDCMILIISALQILKIVRPLWPRTENASLCIWNLSFSIIEEISENKQRKGRKNVYARRRV